MKTMKINGYIVSNDYKWAMDELGLESFCPRELDAVTASLKPAETLTVEINSDGGDVQAGQQIYSTLKALGQEHPIEVRILSRAASAASMIAMAGHEVKMYPVAQLMIHNCSTRAEGDYRTMLHTSEVLQSVNAAIRQAYMEKTGIPEDELIAMMDEESWINANKCVKLGFADAIIRDDSSKLMTNAVMGNSPLTAEMIAQAKAKRAEREAREQELQALRAKLPTYGI